MVIKRVNKKSQVAQKVTIPIQDKVPAIPHPPSPQCRIIARERRKWNTKILKRLKIKK